MLGESVAAVVRGISKPTEDWRLVIEMIMALLIAFSLWWLYYDEGDGAATARVALRNVNRYRLWMYSHLPLAMGIAAAGIAMERAFRVPLDAPMPNGVRWTLFGGLAVCLLAFGTILIGAETNGRGCARFLARGRFVTVGLLILSAVVGGGLTAPAQIGLAALLCLSQPVFDGYFVPRMAARTQGKEKDS